MKKQKVVLFDIDYTLFNTDIFKASELKTHSIYDEVPEVLEKLSEIALLGIFSEGKLLLQQTKLQKTKIQGYFIEAHTHIVEKKDASIEEVLKLYKNNILYLVDDKLTVLHQASLLLPGIITVWVKRGIYAQKQQPIKNFAPHAIIDSLQELIPLVTAR